VALCVAEVPPDASTQHGSDVSASTDAGAKPRIIPDANVPLDSWEWARGGVVEAPHQMDGFRLTWLKNGVGRMLIFPRAVCVAAAAGGSGGAGAV
jgi:hypothetical protein